MAPAELLKNGNTTRCSTIRPSRPADAQAQLIRRAQQGQASEKSGLYELKADNGGSVPRSAPLRGQKKKRVVSAGQIGRPPGASQVSARAVFQRREALLKNRTGKIRRSKVTCVSIPTSGRKGQGPLHLPAGRSPTALYESAFRSPVRRRRSAWRQSTGSVTMNQGSSITLQGTAAVQRTGTTAVWSTKDGRWQLKQSP